MDERDIYNIVETTAGNMFINLSTRTHIADICTMTTLIYMTFVSCIHPMTVKYKHVKLFCLHKQCIKNIHTQMSNVNSLTEDPTFI